MDAIWSLCTHTLFGNYHLRWYTARHFWYSWILSLGTVSKFYPNTTLYTDSLGAQWLVDKLHIPFGEVVVNLDSLRDIDPSLWNYGKLMAYATHPRSFLHIDNDVFLWKRLPPAIEAAPVVAQGVDYPNPHYYRFDLLERNAARLGGWLPKEYKYYRTVPEQHALNCGIFGGKNLEFIHYYANLAMDFVRMNERIWAHHGDLVCESCLAEQYLLSACAYYYKHVDKRFGDVTAACLFEEHDHPWVPEKAEALGYTHLVGEAKGVRAIAERLERRVKNEYPEQHAYVLSAQRDGPNIG